MLDTKKVNDRLIDLSRSLKAYLELSQKDKTKITQGDKQRLKELELELSQILEPQDRSEFIADVAGIARFFKVTVRTVQNWVKLHACPKLRHGLYDMAAVHAWWLVNINVGNDSDETTDIRKEYWFWQKENSRMKAQQTEGALVLRSDIASAWSTRIGEVGAGLYNLASRLPPLLEAKSQSEMGPIIKAEVKKLHDAYSRTGRFCETKHAVPKRIRKAKK